MQKYNSKILRKLYETMIRIRFCEESFVEPIINKQIKCPVHLYTGQEAVAAGVCTALGKRDYLFGNHRSHGHYLAHDGSMNQLVAEVFGKQTGCSRGRGGSMHLYSLDNNVLGTAPIVAGTISLAVGSALASRIKRERKVTVSFFGDGATGEGVLYESLNLASLMKLPVLFVCENNLYSTHMPIKECRHKNNIYQTAVPFGIQCYRIDGNDVLKVYETAKKAVAECKSGRGPVFIECLTYRMRGHVGPNDNVQGQQTDIRPEKEINKWNKKDPVKRFEKYLMSSKIISNAGLEKIKNNAIKEVSDAYEFMEKSPYPNKSELINYVFKT